MNARSLSVPTNAQAIREGGATFIPLVVEEAQEEELEADAGVDMCVSDLSVAVEIDHGCTGQLRLTLYGPGPLSGDTRRPENVPRAEPALLFVGYNGTDGVSDDAANGAGGCGVGMSASFTDSAEDGVWECCGKGRCVYVVCCRVAATCYRFVACSCRMISAHSGGDTWLFTSAQPRADFYVRGCSCVAGRNITASKYQRPAVPPIGTLLADFSRETAPTLSPVFPRVATTFASQRPNAQNRKNHV